MPDAIPSGVAIDDDGAGDKAEFERSLTILGERWALLIVGEALKGVTRFAEFERRLGLPPNSLSERLSMLVDYGILVRGTYREPGQRTRPSYHLTAAGRQLHVLLAALSEWSNEHLPLPDGPDIFRIARRTGLPVHLAFIDERGYEVAVDDVVIERLDG